MPYLFEPELNQHVHVYLFFYELYYVWRKVVCDVS